MSKYILYPAIYLLGVFISSIAQIILKKSANKKSDKNIASFTAEHLPDLYGKMRESRSKICVLLRKYKPIIIEYLNPSVLLAYFIFFSATLMTIYSYKFVPLSYAPVLGTTEYIFIAILSRLFLKEKISKKKFVGFCIILIGIFIFSLKF